jgi:fused signal recognition particle receptor
VVAAIAKTHPVPIKLIGIGEGVDDLRAFRAAEFVDALVG